MTNNNDAQDVSSLKLAISVSCLLAFGQVCAAEVDAEFRAGYMWTDNVFLDDAVEESESISTGGLSLSLNRESSRVILDIQGTLDYMHYAEAFDAEVIGGIDAGMEFAFVQEKLSWVVEDSFGQRLLDPLRSPNPTNREDVNFFSTGPNLNLPFGNRFFVDLEARGSVVTYEESDNGNDRLSGDVFLGRSTGEDSALSIGASMERISYDEPGVFDELDINEYFLNYRLGSNRDVVDIDLGYTELDAADEVFDGSLVRVDWTHVMPNSRRLRLSAGSDYSTQADRFRSLRGNAQNLTVTEDTNVNDEPFRHNFFLARLSGESDRTEFAVELNWTEEDYEAAQVNILLPQNLDREALSINVYFRRDLTSRIYASTNLHFGNSDYKYTDREDDNLSAEVKFGYRISAAFSVYLRARYRDRESTEVGDSYDENRYDIGFAFVPAWGRR